MSDMKIKMASIREAHQDLYFPDAALTGFLDELGDLTKTATGPSAADASAAKAKTQIGDSKPLLGGLVKSVKSLHAAIPQGMRSAKAPAPSAKKPKSQPGPGLLSQIKSQGAAIGSMLASTGRQAYRDTVGEVQKARKTNKKIDTAHGWSATKSGEKTLVGKDGKAKAVGDKAIGKYQRGKEDERFAAQERKAADTAKTRAELRRRTEGSRPMTAGERAADRKGKYSPSLGAMNSLTGLDAHKSAPSRAMTKREAELDRIGKRTPAMSQQVDENLKFGRNPDRLVPTPSLQKGFTPAPKKAPVKTEIKTITERPGATKITPSQRGGTPITGPITRKARGSMMGGGSPAKSR